MLIDVPHGFSEMVLAENGLDHEAIVCVEELSELQKEITKFLRGKGDLDALVSEIADVYICLNTLEIGTQISYRELEDKVKEKVDRYYKRRKEGDIK